MISLSDGLKKFSIGLVLSFRYDITVRWLDRQTDQ